MKKSAAKIISLLLLLLTVLSVSACAKRNADYSGIYTGQIDYTSEIGDVFAEKLQIEVSDPLYMDMTLVLGTDNTFRISADGEKFKADVIAIMKNHIDDILLVMLENYGAGPDQLGDLAAENGYNDVDALKQAMMNQMEAEMNKSMDLDAYGDQMTADGTYKAEKGKITLTSGDRSDALTIREDGSLSFIISEMDDFELILTKQDEN